MSATLAASVVVPTHGRRSSLLRVLRALADQTVPPGAFETVVVCDGDADGSAAAARDLAPHLPYALRVLEQTNQGPAAARNRGVRAARAPLIVFLDDDVVPDSGWIAAHLEAQAGQEALVTIGPLLPPLDARLNAWGAWEELMLCRQYDAMEAGRWPPSYRQFYTGNAAVLKRHVEDAGGFDAAFRRAEDVELARRLHDRGLRFAFLPHASGRHYVQRDFTAWLRIPTAYGAADVAMARNGRPEVLRMIAREFGHRNHVIHAATWLCVGRAAVMDTTVLLLGLLARLSDALRLAQPGTAACSLIFNLRYYDGIAAALGGRDSFQRLLRDRDTADRPARPLGQETAS